MIIEYSISEASVNHTRVMLRAEEAGDKILFDTICFAEITIRNDNNYKINVVLVSILFFIWWKV